MAASSTKPTQPRSAKRENAPARKRDRAATQKALIDAGEHLFARHGFNGVTLDMIAQASGANKAMVAYYFGSKHGLYDAVIAALVNDVLGAVSAGLNVGNDPVKNFRRYISALAMAFVERETFCAILMREYIDGSMQEREAPFRQVLQFYQMTERLYEAGRKARLFRKLDAHQLHLSIIGPLVHFILTRRLRKRTIVQHGTGLTDPTVEAFAKHLAKLILDGACVQRS